MSFGYKTISYVRAPQSSVTKNLFGEWEKNICIELEQGKLVNWVWLSFVLLQ